MTRASLGLGCDDISVYIPKDVHSNCLPSHVLGAEHFYTREIQMIIQPLVLQFYKHSIKLTCMKFVVRDTLVLQARPLVGRGDIKM